MKITWENFKETGNIETYLLLKQQETTSTIQNDEKRKEAKSASYTSKCE